MGDAYRGLTIRIGADTSQLQRSMKSLNSAATQLQRSFRAASKALRVDGGNLAMQNTQVRLLGQQAETSAAKLARLAMSERQASQQTKNLANSTRNAALEEARLHNSLVSVDARLQSFYDAYARVKSGMKSGKEFDAAHDHIRRLATDFHNGGDGAKAFAAEVRSLVMTKGNGFSDPFGLGSGVKGANAYLSALKSLNAEWHRLSSAEASMKEASSLQHARSEAELLRADIRALAIEETEALAKMQQMGTGGFRTAALDIQAIDNALKQVGSDAELLDKAMRLDPGNLEAAKLKFSSLEQTTKLLEDRIAAAQKRMNMFDQSKIASIEKEFGSVGRAVDVTSSKLAKAKARASELHGDLDLARESLEAMRVNPGTTGSIKEASNKVKELERRARSADKEVDELSRDFATFNNAHAAKRAAVEVTYFKSELANAKRQIDTATSALARFLKVGASIKTLGYSLSATLGAGAMMIGMRSIQSADDFDSAYRDMRKTVNGSEEDFEHLRQAALKFSQTHFTSASQILEIEAIGGQLGIQVQNLEKFAETASNLDIATNLDTETISQNLGQLSNIMNDMDQDIQTGPGSLEAYSDALVRLGNNSAAQEDKIQNVMMRIASMGTISGMSTPDLLALATATAATGQGAEAAGTAISKTFSNIEGAVNGADAALQKIRDTPGLAEDEIEDLTKAVEDGQASLRDFAQVAGMSADEFKNAWNNDPTTAFQAFIGGLKRIDAEGGSVDSTLKSLGINSVRQKQTLNGLVQTFDVLNDSLKMSNNAWNGVSDQWGAAGDAAREAQRKAEGFSGSLQKLRNAGEAFGVTMTDSLTPVIQVLTDALSGLNAVLDVTPGPVKTIMSVLGGAATIAGPAGILIGGVADGVEAIQKVSGKASTAFAKSMAKIASGAGIAAAATGTATGSMMLADGTIIKMTYDVGKLGAASELASGSVGKLAAVSNLIKGLPKGAIFGWTAAATVSIGACIYGFQRLQEQHEKLAIISETTGDRILNAMNKARSSIDQTASASERVSEIADMVAKHNEKLEERNRNLGTAAEEAFSKSAEIKRYADDVSKYMRAIDKGGKLSDEAFSHLKARIDRYNDATGDSITVTKDETGAISVLRGETKLTADEFERLANNKRLANQSSVYGDEANAANKSYMEEQEILQEQVKAFEQYAKDYAEAYQRYLNKEDGAWNDMKTAEENMQAMSTAIGMTTEKLREYNAEIDRNEQLQLLTDNATKETATAYETLIANNDNLMASFASSDGTVYGFINAMKNAGISAEELGKVNIESAIRNWNGDFGMLIVALRDAGLKIDDTQDKLIKLSSFRLDGSGQTFRFDVETGELRDAQGILLDINNFVVGDHTYRINVETGEVIEKFSDGTEQVADFIGTVNDIPEKPTVNVEAETEAARKKIEELCKGPNGGYTAKVNVVYSETNKPALGGTIASAIKNHTDQATGGMLPRAQMYANGGRFVNEPTVIGRTGNIAHIAGEAGPEYVSYHAKGGVVLPLSNPQMRPWVKAVASQMSGGNVVNHVSIRLAVGADANAKDVTRAIAREIRLHGLMG